MTQRSFPIVGQNLTDADWQSIFGRRCAVLGDHPNAYFATRIADTNTVQIGSAQTASRAVVAGFGHQIDIRESVAVTIPAATNTTIGRNDLIVLRYDPQHTGPGGPVRLHRIAGIDGQAAAPAHNQETDLPLWEIRRISGQAIQLATITDARLWDVQTAARSNGAIVDRVAGQSGRNTSLTPVGSVLPFAGYAAPPGWLVCDGRSLRRAEFPALFEVLGTRFGEGAVEGRDFNLPDMRQRFALARGSWHHLGQTGGAETVTLTTAQMPSHTHTQAAHTHTSAAHTHSINHDHAAVNTSSNGAHTHTINHGHGAATTSSNGAHTHNVPAANGGMVQSTGSGTLHRATQLPSGTGAGDPWGVRLGTGFGGTEELRLRTPALTAASAGAHTHTVTVPNHSGNSGSAGAHTHTVDLPNFTGTSGSTTPGPTGSATPTIHATGGGQAHPNMPPFLVLTYLIKT